MGTRTLSENHLVEDVTVQEDDIKAFLRLPEEQRFQVMRTLRHEASLLSGGGLGPMAGIYFAAVVASLPLLTALSLQGNKPWTLAVSIAVGALTLISGLYLTLQVILTQRRYARSATRLAFYEDALRKMPHPDSRSSSRVARWLRRAGVSN
jgi:hypothetical protein